MPAKNQSGRQEPREQLLGSALIAFLDRMQEEYLRGWVNVLMYVKCLEKASMWETDDNNSYFKGKLNKMQSRKLSKTDIPRNSKNEPIV